MVTEAGESEKARPGPDPTPPGPRDPHDFEGQSLLLYTDRDMGRA
jgi:hypothetical protein